MRHIRHKLFLAWDFDKEEKWLNEMASIGLSLVAVGFGKYTFEETPPGQDEIRLDLLQRLPSTTESTQYIRFLEENNVEYIGSFLRWAYFKGKRNESGFKLYSDFDSKINYLKRVLLLTGLCAVAEIILGIMNVVIYAFSGYQTINLVLGMVLILVGLLMAIGFVKLFLKKKRLAKENLIFSD